MSQTATLSKPQNTLNPMSLRAMMLAVALVSLSSLLLELALTRLFSVVLFYHFAFFAISVALLGLGSGGVFAHIRRAWLEQFEMRRLGAGLCLLNSICILGSVEVVLHTPVSLAVTAGNFGKLTIIYLAAAVPFFLTGLLFSVLFARSANHIPQLYGADLAGGATACLAVVPLLNFIGAPNALLLASACMAVAAALWSDRIKMRRLACALAGLFVVLIAANHSGKLLDVIYAKGVYHDPKWVEYSRWNAISRIEVDTHLGGRYVVIDADATTAIMNVNPALWDKNAAPTPMHTGLPDTSGFNWKQSLMSAAPSLANVLRPHGDFAIIGPGGGVDVMRAVANGSPSVMGIEINPTIANNVMRDRYANYSFHLYDLPQVHIYVQDGRSYVRSSHEKYDVVQMTLVDTWASTAAGAFALSENNLYTVEAFREYFDHLKPDGMIAITRWEFKQPREALRVVSQGIEALHQIGVADPKEHFIIVADGNLDEDGRPVLVLAKKSAFTSAEYSAVESHVRANPNLVWLNPAVTDSGCGPNVQCSMPFTEPLASIPSAAARPLPPAAAAFQKLIESNDPRGFAQNYAYNVAPVSDSAPFFFFTLKTRHVIENILAGTGHGMDWRINLGVVVLGMLLIISIVAVLAFLILPLALHRHQAQRAGTSIVALLYFIAVGFGFILVEISLIQRFVLFLGHPTYALTVVVFLLLLSSGAGSMAARRRIDNGSKILPLLVFICALIVLHVFLLPWLLAAAVGLPFTVKLLISGAVLAPLGFLMGMPFPSGLRLVKTVEWAWALNAAASVLGSVMAMIIAIHFGLTVTLLCAAVAYLLAAGFSRTWRKVAIA